VVASPAPTDEGDAVQLGSPHMLCSVLLPAARRALACPCSQRVDIGLWTDAVADMAKCLEQPDVDDPQSAAHLRCVQLVALVERVFILKVTH
jgi:hypothetical protein